MTTLRLSTLDTDRFGVRTVRHTVADHSQVPALFAGCRELDAELLIVRCDTDDVDAVVAIEDAGGRLMDTLLYYERSLDDWKQPESASDVTLRPVAPDDRDRVEQIARAAFAGYRGHYHVDRRLDAGACDDAYASWALRACEDPSVADTVIVAELEGTVVGFAALRINSATEAEGVLYGVHPAARRRGVYQRLMDESLTWSRQRAMDRFVISTQLSNIVVRRVWAGLGLVPYASWHTFHAWLDTPAAAARVVTAGEGGRHD